MHSFGVSKDPKTPEFAFNNRHSAPEHLYWYCLTKESSELDSVCDVLDPDDAEERGNVVNRGHSIVPGSHPADDLWGPADTDQGGRLDLIEALTQQTPQQRVSERCGDTNRATPPWIRSDQG